MKSWWVWLFFDDNVIKKVKKQIGEAINLNDGIKNPPKRVIITIGDVQGKTVVDFATKQRTSLDCILMMLLHAACWTMA